MLPCGRLSELSEIAVRKEQQTTELLTCMVKTDGSWTRGCSSAGLLAILQGCCFEGTRVEALAADLTAALVCNATLCHHYEDRRKDWTYQLLQHSCTQVTDLLCHMQLFFAFAAVVAKDDSAPGLLSYPSIKT